MANLTGDTVTGVLNFSGGTMNYFDPVNGHVPGSSSGIQPSAVVDAFHDLDVERLLDAGVDVAPALDLARPHVITSYSIHYTKLYDTYPHIFSCNTI